MGLLDVNLKSIRVIRSELIASKDGLTTSEISKFYREYFKEPLGKSERDVENWLDSQTDLCTRSHNIHGKTVWNAVKNGDTAHVQKLVGKQKPKKKKAGTKDIIPTRIVREREQISRPPSYSRNVTAHSNIQQRTVMTRSSYEASKRMTMFDSNRNITISEKYVERNKPSTTSSNSNWGIHSNSVQGFSPRDEVSRSESPQIEEYYPKEPPRDYLERRSIAETERSNDERQTDFGSTNSDSQTSCVGRPSKTGTSRYKLSREGMKRFLIDQVSKNGQVQFEYLHEVFNKEFIVKRLKMKPLALDKFSEIMKPIFVSDLNNQNGIVSLPKRDTCTDKEIQTDSSLCKEPCARCEERDSLESVMLGFESRIMSLISELVLKKRKRNPFHE